MTAMCRRGVVLSAALFLSVSAAAQPSGAATHCAPRKVAATGAVAPMSFFARSKARAAWIGKVTRDPGLGATYAQWLRAAERRIVCRQLDKQHFCLAAALPCRKVAATIAAPDRRSV